MREIKFRGKRLMDGRWIYGYFWATPEFKAGIIDPDGSWPVDPETVGQFTGLKDCKGREIYEGDIAELTTVSYCGERPPFEPEIHTRKGVIKWENCAFILDVFEDTFGDMDKITISKTLFDFGRCAEIVGNIHDNPEMLKQKEGGE